MPKRTVLAWIYVFLSASWLFGQRYNFKFYGEEEGLQSLAVQVVFQDRAGFLWVGTQNGLYRYDGNRFVGFGKAEGLPDAHIESLHEAIDGTLVVGTPSLHFTLVANPATADGSIATSVYVDSKGVVWFGCGSSLCTLDKGQA